MTKQMFQDHIFSQDQFKRIVQYTKQRIDFMEK